ncbi:MAG: LacI family DNA-binding transcriptional regulator, partial [Chloroflexota bacterium]
MGVTIEEVAREAGVSRSTVSLVVRGRRRVAATTRGRVQAAIERLGYQPNHLAAGLRSKRSRLLGLVVSSLAYPHHAQIALGIEEAVEDAGYSVLVANSRNSLQREQRHIERLRRYHADGLLITPLQISAGEASHLKALVAEGYPLVTVYREIPGLEIDFCGVDTYGSVRQLVGYLAQDLGHERIALVAGDLGNPITDVRVAAWRDALAEQGLSADDGLLTGRAPGREGGEAAIGDLIARDVAFTAVVCINDFLALGALRALHEAGRQVPDEVSVAALGGFETYASPEKPLTVLAYDYGEIGRQAGELLRRRIERQQPGGVERIVVPATLRVGGTT